MKNYKINNIKRIIHTLSILISTTAIIFLGEGCGQGFRAVTEQNLSSSSSAPTPPTITMSPQPQIITQGGQASLSVVVSGTAPFTYQWYKNGIAIAGAINANLIISNALSSDTGNYTVTVMNSVGSASSTPCVLTVNPPVNNMFSPAITTQPTSRILTVGESVTFTVAATGTAPLTYQWRFNNTNIAGATNVTYTIASAQSANDGLYSVQVTNAVGSVISNAATLTVQIPLVITQQPMSQTVNSGATVNFSVLAMGSGPFSYQWRKNASPIAGMNQPTLTLSNVYSLDSADYSVVISNAVSTVTSASAKLNVNIVPSTFSEVLPILQAKCTGCHSATGSASFANFNFTTESQFFSSKWFTPGVMSAPVIQRMKFGPGGTNATMPINTLSWTSSEYEKVSSWILAGQPVTNPDPVTYNPQFSCTPNTTIMPSTIQRLSKTEFTNSLIDFMSRIPASSQAGVINNLQSKLDQWLPDSSELFTRWDNQVTQSHADTVIEVALDMATQLVNNSALINAMIRDTVCGSTATIANLDTANCLQSFVKYYGQKSYRRPLSAAETTEFTNFYNSLSGNDRVIALLARMISHPRFFYKLDIGENGGSTISGTDGVDSVYNLGKYELLSKMTFLYWAAPPDDSLYSLVATLDLNVDANLNSVINTILSSPKAYQGTQKFYEEWLQLDHTPKFDNLSAAFKTLTTGENIGVPGHDYRQEMINEITDMTKYYTFSTAGRFEDLLNSQYSFAKGTDLAKIYGVSAWDGTNTNLVKFPDLTIRSGLLTRAAMIASASEYTRPIIKGKKVRTRMLCDDVPPPPADLVIKPLVQDPNLTTIQVVERTTSDSKCMSCHSQMNYIGFSTENFDSIGRYRPFEKKFDTNGNVVNQLSVNTRTPANIFQGDSKVTNNAVDMSAYVASSGKGHQCFVRQYFRFSHGRKEDLTQDGCSLENMRLKLMSTDGTLLQTLKEAAKQTSFRRRKVN